MNRIPKPFFVLIGGLLGFLMASYSIQTSEPQPFLINLLAGSLSAVGSLIFFQISDKKNPSRIAVFGKYLFAGGAIPFIWRCLVAMGVIGSFIDSVNKFLNDPVKYFENLFIMFFIGFIIYLGFYIFKKHRGLVFSLYVAIVLTIIWMLGGMYLNGFWP